MAPQPHLHWKNLDELESSLREFQRMYAADPAQRRALREKVIETKDRARFASHNPKVAPDKRAQKAEMVRWMLVWLDDPELFPTWVSLRRQSIAREERS